MKHTRIFLLTALLTLFMGSVAHAASPYMYEPPVPAGYDMPYTLSVYLSRQMVVAYDGKTGQPVRTMICSSGAKNCTPTMTVTMPSTYTSGWDKWGNVYVRYPTRIRGSYFFHSTTYNLDKTPNAISWRALGKMASHGCIRMTPRDAQWINYNCKRGTRIRIVNVDDTGLNLKDKHDAIRAALNRDGIGSVGATLRPTPTPLPPTLDSASTQMRLIKSLQSNLKGHGFYNGGLTGKFDAGTLAAWNAYQKTQGWAEDGTATTEEQVVLASDEMTVAYNVDLKSGSTGLIVKRVEERLKELGYFKLTANKTYDGNTTAAVKNYQLSAGLVPANGKLLAGQQARLFSGVAPTPTPQPDLAVGSKGARVRSLQQRLYSLGCYAGTADGTFRASTEAAVRMYQEMAGLTVTGSASNVLQNQIAADNTVVGYARRLSVGAKGFVVKSLEQALQTMGLFSGTPDVIYDKATATAVKQLQTQQGETPTGVAASALLKTIFTR